MFKLRFPILHPMYANVVLSILRCLCKSSRCSYTTPLSKHKMSKAMASTLMTSDSAGHKATDLDDDDDVDYEQVYGGFAPALVGHKGSIGHTDGCSESPLGSEIFFDESETKTRISGNSRVPRANYRYNISTKQPESRSGELLMTVNDLHARLSALSSEQLEVLGIPKDSSHPSSLILYYIPVMPTYIRPVSSILERETEHNITRLYMDMISTLTSGVGYETVNQERYQYHAHHYYSKIIGFPKKGNRDNITCKSMFSRKEGLLRSHLLGKRCNLTGRSVLTEDITLKINEIGIPRAFADILTVSQSGYTRGLQDGDITLGNRNPSLTQTSIGGFKVKIHEHLSVAINPIVTASFNADHDGDEFNLFVPNGAKASDEIRSKMMIESNIISRKDSKPCYGPIQDTVVAMFILSDELAQVTKSEFMDCCPDVILSDHAERVGVSNLYTGRSMISTLFKDTFNYSSNGTIISKGILKKGRLTSGSLWKKKASIIEAYNDVYSSDDLVEFLTQMQLMCVRYLLIRGFSVSVNDYISANPIGTILEVEDIRTEDETLHDEINATTDRDFSTNDQIEWVIYVIFANRFEKMSDLLNTYMRDVHSNPVLTMLTSESKGSRSNLMQAMMSVGQQTIASGRPTLQQKYDRSDEHDIVKRGYCYNSFFDGLNHTEFLFQLIAGREGNINTSINTELTGYDQRTMVNFSGPITIADDGTVCMSNGGIVQFVYGRSSSDLAKCSSNLSSVVYDQLVS